MEINVENLSKLSRIRISGSDSVGLSENISSILEYSSKVQKVSGSIDASSDEYIGDIKNIFREDVSESKFSFKTSDIINSFPKSKKGYLSVKKIL